MKKLLLFLCLPLLGKAQDVQPIISPDYLWLIRKDTALRSGGFFTDTTNHISRSTVTVRLPYNGHSVGKIKIRNGELSVLPRPSKVLMIAGSFSSTVEMKSVNRLPALQNNFVQGRSQNGSLVWNGPETGEQFSYGPAIHTLEYDGDKYAYDVHGRLVAKGTGRGKAANGYSTNIFRTGALASQTLSVQARYLKSWQQLLQASIRVGRSNEKLFVQNNRNSSRSLAATVESQLSWLQLTATFQTTGNEYSNENRNGFLTHVYQQALLTPVSFDNKQGTSLGSQQRSYHSLADNPFYLLENNRNAASQWHRGGSFSLVKKTGDFRFSLSQSLEKTTASSNEGLPAATAYFPNGLLVQRTKTDRHYLLRGTSSYDFRHGDGYLNSRILLNYLFGNHGSIIQYNPGAAYRFQRSVNEVGLNAESTYRDGDLAAGLNLTNRSYFSNTAKDHYILLPGISGFVSSENVFGLESLFAKLTASYHRFASELSVGSSFSQHSLLNFTTAEALHYFPLTEAEGFDALSLINHRESSLSLQLRYKNRLTLEANVFKRNTQYDVFPFVENGLLQLGNLADHQNTGFEIEAGYASYSRNFQTSHQASFVVNRSTVTAVRNGYGYRPVAGFKNVHKALVKGEPLGAIVGSRYLRNAAGKMIIGADGFPLVDPQLGVVGNPIPDFVLKTANSISWKRLSFAIDLEWRKGGDVWNGTQAVLDYYGRSENSGDLRGITGYVYDGVMQDGQPNKTAVTFYNAALPLEQSRWVRYGHSGVAEDYIEKADHLRINNLSLAYKLTTHKYLQSVTFSLYANNLLLWTAYTGADSNRLLYDAANTTGIDFFNLPSVKTFGCNLSFQF